jgi:hypothetical protein
VLDKVRTRQQPPEPPKATKPADKKKTKDAAEKKDPKGMLADLQLRKMAIDAFKQGHDALSLTLSRNDKSVNVDVQLDQGILLLVGKAASKLVKDNLGED